MLHVNTDRVTVFSIVRNRYVEQDTHVPMQHDVYLLDERPNSCAVILQATTGVAAYFFLVLRYDMSAILHGCKAERRTNRLVDLNLLRRVPCSII